jgi:hypothetical protein
MSKAVILCLSRDPFISNRHNDIAFLLKEEVVINNVNCNNFIIVVCLLYSISLAIDVFSMLINVCARKEIN